MVAGTAHQGAFRRAATSSTWSSSTTGITASRVSSLAAPPSGGRTVYAGTEWQGVFRSDDDGASWRAAGLAGRFIRGLAVSPTSASTVWAAAHDGVHRSTDGGLTWVRQLQVPFQDATDVAVAPSAPATVYATTFEGGVWRSTDSGATWTRLGLRNEVVAWSLAIHPTDPRTVWVGTRFGGIARTTDGGATWREDPAMSYDWLDLAVDPANPSRVYGAQHIGGIWRSLDGGTTWVPATGGTPPPTAAAVALDPSKPGRVYAAGYFDHGPGPYVSDDHGVTWRPLFEGLSTRWSASLAVQRSGTAHLGTTGIGSQAGGGTYRYLPQATPALPQLDVGDVTAPEGEAGSTSVALPVRLSAPSTEQVTVQYRTVSGTAGSADHRSVSGTVTFPAGTTTRSISLSVLGDSLDEPTEAFAVELSAPTGAALADASASVTIVDDDAPPQMSVSDVRTWEGNGGSASAYFSVRLSAPAVADTTVSYTTAAGSAISGTDYSARTGSLTFTPGQVSMRVSVSVRSDTLDEPDEAFSLNLSGLTGPATMADSSGSATILDDDPTATGSTPNLRIGDLTLVEGNSGSTSGTLTVRLSAPTTSTVTAAYSLTGDTAGAADFTSASGTISIPAGASAATIRGHSGRRHRDRHHPGRRCRAAAGHLRRRRR
jgi:photosystem II stability/assembly factor-like uncharacterized protein